MSHADKFSRRRLPTLKQLIREFLNQEIPADIVQELSPANDWRPTIGEYLKTYLQKTKDEFKGEDKHLFPGGLRERRKAHLIDFNQMIQALPMIAKKVSGQMEGTDEISLRNRVINWREFIGTQGEALFESEGEYIGAKIELHEQILQDFQKNPSLVRKRAQDYRSEFAKQGLSSYDLSQIAGITSLDEINATFVIDQQERWVDYLEGRLEANDFILGKFQDLILNQGFFHDQKVRA